MYSQIQNLGYYNSKELNSLSFVGFIVQKATQTRVNFGTATHPDFVIFLLYKYVLNQHVTEYL